MLKTITSRDNPTVKRLQALSGSSRERRQQGQTLLDGAHLVQSAVNAGIALRQLIVSDSGMHDAEIASLLHQHETTLAIQLTDTLFRQISPVDTPSGMLALIDSPGPEPGPVGGDSLLVLDSVQDSGNLGTILRTAAAAGLRRVLLTRGCAQAWSPRVLRAGMGGHFHLVIQEQLDTDDVAALLQGYPGDIAATTLSGQSAILYETDLSGAVAWLFGAEGQGLSPAMQSLATTHVKIPMPGAVESLNVAAAAAICLFEQLRQRMCRDNAAGA